MEGELEEVRKDWESLREQVKDMTEKIALFEARIRQMESSREDEEIWVQNEMEELKVRDIGKIEERHSREVKKLKEEIKQAHVYIKAQKAKIK